MGKPSIAGFDIIRREHELEEVPLSKFLMIGDFLETDIRFAKNCGIDSLLVLSGATSADSIKESLLKDKSDVKPTYIQPRLAFSHQENVFL